MPSEFYNLTLAGFRESLREVGRDVTCEGVTKTQSCIHTPVLLVQDIELQGYLPGANCTVEMERATATTLGIEDRSEITVQGITERLAVMLIDNDPAEPCIRFACKHAR